MHIQFESKSDGNLIHRKCASRISHDSHDYFLIPGNAPELPPKTPILIYLHTSFDKILGSFVRTSIAFITADRKNCIFTNGAPLLFEIACLKSLSRYIAYLFRCKHASILVSRTCRQHSSHKHFLTPPGIPELPASADVPSFFWCTDRSLVPHPSHSLSRLPKINPTSLRAVSQLLPTSTMQCR